MSVNLVFMQVPLVGEVAGALQATPEAQQVLTQQAAQEAHKLAQSQVQKLDAKEGAKAVNPDGSQGHAGGSPHGRRQRRQKEEPRDEKKSADIWAGNIINKRV